MYKDLEPEPVLQADDALEEFSIEPAEADVTPQLNERLVSWLDIIDR